MKKIFSLSFLLLSLLAFSQITIPAKSEKGILITQTDQKIEYRNLKYEKGKVVYTNTQTNQEEFLYDSSLKNIQENNGAVLMATPNSTEPIEAVSEQKLTSTKDIKNYLIKENNLQYKSGKSINTIGTVFVVGGAVCFVAGGISNLSHANKISSGEEAKGSSVPLILGLVGAGIGVVMKISGHSQMKKAITAYKNADSRKFAPSYYVLNNKNGVGVMMKF